MRISLLDLFAWATVTTVAAAAVALGAAVSLQAPATGGRPTLVSGGPLPVTFAPAVAPAQAVTLSSAAELATTRR